MPDPDGPPKRRFGELRLQIPQLALGSSALEPAVFQGGDTGGIVSAVLQALQCFDDLRGDSTFPEDSDNPAH